MGFWWLWPLLIIALVALLVMTWRRADPWPRRAQSGSPADGAAVRADDVLAERFARGEIDESEYRHRLDVLRDAGGRGPQRPSP